MPDLRHTIDKAVAITNSMQIAYDDEKWDVISELYIERQPLLTQLCADHSMMTASSAHELRSALDLIFQADQKITALCRQSLNDCTDQLNQLSTRKKMVNAYQQLDRRK